MHRLSDRTLLSRLESLAGEEHATTVEILLHLNEVERRRLHLSLGYASLFDFATRCLCYSASAAGRRIQVARCLRRHRELLDPLRRRELNLSTIALICPILDEGNEEELIGAIRGKSQREVERIVASYRPAVEVRDRVSAVRAHANGRTTRLGDSGAAIPLFMGASAEPARSSGGGRGPRDADGSRGETAAAASVCPSAARDEAREKFKIQFAAGPELVRKLDEARAVLSRGRSRAVGLEELFESALDAFLDRNCPSRRQRRRERRSGRGGLAHRAASGTRPATEVRASRKARDPGGPPAAAQASATLGNPRSRHVPAAVRDAVFARDGGRCTYVGPAGIACGSRYHLQVDHVEPFARGGPATLENLRLLCAGHNTFEAERVYGSEWMTRYRREEPG